MCLLCLAAVAGKLWAAVRGGVCVIGGSGYCAGRAVGAYLGGGGGPALRAAAATLRAPRLLYGHPGGSPLAERCAQSWRLCARGCLHLLNAARARLPRQHPAPAGGRADRGAVPAAKASATTSSRACSAEASDAPTRLREAPPAPPARPPSHFAHLPRPAWRAAGSRWAPGHGVGVGSQPLALHRTFGAEN